MCKQAKKPSGVHRSNTCWNAWTKVNWMNYATRLMSNSDGEAVGLSELLAERESQRR